MFTQEVVKKMIISSEAGYVTGTVMNVSGGGTPRTVRYPPWDRGRLARRLARACKQQDADRQTRSRRPRSQGSCRNAAQRRNVARG